MDEPFLITIDYNGKVLDFTAQLQIYGYTHRFVVDVFGTDMHFERDEDGAYRAMIPYDASEKHLQKLDVHLLQAIATKIESILA